MEIRLLLWWTIISLASFSASQCYCTESLPDWCSRLSTDSDHKTIEMALLASKTECSLTLSSCPWLPWVWRAGSSDATRISYPVPMKVKVQHRRFQYQYFMKHWLGYRPNWTVLSCHNWDTFGRLWGFRFWYSGLKPRCTDCASAFQGYLIFIQKKHLCALRYSGNHQHQGLSIGYVSQFCLSVIGYSLAANFFVFENACLQNQFARHVTTRMSLFLWI